jgi:hypothetical protein
VTGAVEVRSSDIYEVIEEAFDAAEAVHEAHTEAGVPEWRSCPVCGDEDGRSL